MNINACPEENIFQLLGRLWLHLSARRRFQFGLLLFLMVVSAFAELLSIGTVLPFLGLLSAPDSIFSNPFAKPVIQTLGIKDPEQLLLVAMGAFCLATLMAGATRFLLLVASVRISVATGVDISASVYLRALYQPYAVHVTRNSSEIISGISSKADSVIYSAILPVLTLIGSSVILIAILLTIMWVDPVIAIAIFGSFGLAYAILIRFTRRTLLINSQIGARETALVLKALQEGLGGIRDVLINGTQEAYCKVYLDANLPLRRAQGSSSIIGASPRYAIEALGMLAIAVLAYIFAQQQNGIAKLIPVLGAVVVGAQRLLPVLQQGYHSWSTIRGGQKSLQDVLSLLDQPLPEYAGQLPPLPIPFRQHISLRQLYFRYNSGTPWVLQDLNLKIVKGSRVGLIGKTGSGKSTLIDIFMSLLQPSKGALEIDGVPVTVANGRSWQAHIAHVPQAIYLADCSIEENIAFGVEKDKINHARVREAAQKAQMADTIESWPRKYQTFVGENGIRLSGGQRQRIGIARALYKVADVIIFDEATSALDNETEEAVMQAIYGISKEITLFIVAHRLTTLKKCSVIIELEGGTVLQTGTYESIVTKLAPIDG
jgi:ABC-type multidrug transport system fused ATPase/permease subunit